MKKILIALGLSIVAPVCAESASVDYPKFESTLLTIISNRIFETSYPTLMEQLNGVCFPLNKAPKDHSPGNSGCAREAGIRRLDIIPTGGSPVWHVSVIFAAADNCDAAKRVLTKRFGKPTRNKAGCTAEWKLKRSKDGAERRAILEPNGPGEGLFDLAEEQGP